MRRFPRVTVRGSSEARYCNCRGAEGGVAKRGAAPHEIRLHAGAGFDKLALRLGLIDVSSTTEEVVAAQCH